MDISKDKSKKFNWTILNLTLTIILVILLVLYVGRLSDINTVEPQDNMTLTNETVLNISLTVNENKVLNISNLNDTIMIDENKTLADNKTLLNQS